MKILLILTLDFFIIFGLLIVKFMFHSYFERKNDNLLAFNIVHFPNFEILRLPLISAAL